MPEQAFRVEGRRKPRTNAFEADQHCHGRRGVDGGWDCHSVPLAFHSLDLVEQQLQAVELAADLGPDIARELAAIAGSKLY